MMSHINSYAREKYAGKSPTELFVDMFGEDVLHLLRQLTYFTYFFTNYSLNLHFLVLILLISFVIHKIYFGFHRLRFYIFLFGRLIF